MSKEEKHMGIPKPKYDPKKTKPKVIRATKAKPFLLIIPEREPTGEEALEAEQSRLEHRWWPEWFMPWKEHRINKYTTEKAANEALRTYKRRIDNGTDTYHAKFFEMERAIIVDTRSKK